MTKISKVKGSRYILENTNEAERLERQSHEPEYDFKIELTDLSVPESSLILDAGCGSGVVTRYLASRLPTSKIIGIDSSSQRIEQARSYAKDINNIEFIKSDLSQIEANDQLQEKSFDAVICRYVLHHIPNHATNVIARLVSLIKPGGKIYLIDGDGIFVNLYPKTKVIDQVLSKLEAIGIADFFSGRKLATFLSKSQVINISTRILTHHFLGDSLIRERNLARERIDNILPLLRTIFEEDPLIADRFKKDYLNCMSAPTANYHHSIFVVTGEVA